MIWKNPIVKFVSIFLLVILGGFASLFVIDKVLNLGIVDGILEELNREEVVPVELAVELTEVPEIFIEGYMAIGVYSTKPVTIQDSNRLKLTEAEGQREGFEHAYVLEIFTIDVGGSSVNVTFTDEDGAEVKESIQLVRQGGFSFLGQDYVPGWENTTYLLEGDDYLTPVTKTQRLLASFEPDDLVNLKETYPNMFVNRGDFTLRQEAAEMLETMLNLLRNETGENLVIASAYRSYSEQARLYTGYVRQFGQEEADKFSARPGYSEHQLGTVVDFVNQESGFELTSALDQTVAGKWLLENSHNFGYVQTYPAGSDALTGYNYEAWHYRYIGVENARELKESGQVFIEWRLPSLE